MIPPYSLLYSFVTRVLLIHYVRTPPERSQEIPPPPPTQISSTSVDGKETLHSSTNLRSTSPVSETLALLEAWADAVVEVVDCITHTLISALTG